MKITLKIIGLLILIGGTVYFYFNTPPSSISRPINRDLPSNTSAPRIYFSADGSKFIDFAQTAVDKRFYEQRKEIIRNILTEMSRIKDLAHSSLVDSIFTLISTATIISPEGEKIRYYSSNDTGKLGIMPLVEGDDIRLPGGGSFNGTALSIKAANVIMLDTRKPTSLCYLTVSMFHEGLHTLINTYHPKKELTRDEEIYALGVEEKDAYTLEIRLLTLLDPNYILNVNVEALNIKEKFGLPTKSPIKFKEIFNSISDLSYKDICSRSLSSNEDTQRRYQLSVHAYFLSADLYQGKSKSGADSLKVWFALELYNR